MLKLLVVDDDAVLRREIVQIVHQWGAIPLEASNGKRALDMLADDSHITGIITDYMMPEMDGRQLVEHLRKSAQFSQIPVILTSGVIRLHEITDLLESGVSRFIPKPINQAELRGYLSALFGKHRDMADTEYLSH